MRSQSPASDAKKKGGVLQAYLLGTVDFSACLRLQRQLVYQLSEDRRQGALILCEHMPLVTVGRSGSRSHIRYEPEELEARGLAVRWVNRGGSCWLHLPGQLAIYPVVALDRHGLTVSRYLDRIRKALAGALAEFRIRGSVTETPSGVAVNGRPIAQVGVAIRDWVAYYGAILNMNCELESFRSVRSPLERAMTSLERERRAPVRVGLVRQAVSEHIASQFGFSQILPFSDHPALPQKAIRNAAVASR